MVLHGEGAATMEHYHLLLGGRDVSCGLGCFLDLLQEAAEIVLVGPCLYGLGTET